MKETLEKCLIVDISSIREIIKRNEIEVTWIEKERQIGDVYKTTGVFPSELPNVLSTSKMIRL